MRFFVFPHQSILNSDETTHVLENLEPDQPYDVSVTAIYPDESESEDLMGTERTCKIRIPAALFLTTINPFNTFLLSRLTESVLDLTKG